MVRVTDDHTTEVRHLMVQSESDPNTRYALTLSVCGSATCTCPAYHNDSLKGGAPWVGTCKHIQAAYDDGYHAPPQTGPVSNPDIAEFIVQGYLLGEKGDVQGLTKSLAIVS